MIRSSIFLVIITIYNVNNNNNYIYSSTKEIYGAGIKNDYKL